MEVIDRQFWAGRRVLLTGHTGFKGGWLALWLRMMGAKVTGLALEPPTRPSFFDIAEVGEALRDVRADIRDEATVRRVVEQCDPEVVLHLAARAIVREAYEHPIEAVGTNVLGTAIVLDACRRAPELRAVVSVTTDKCYENREWDWAYREIDALGGRDPYSSSKACAELVTAAWRQSYFSGGERRVGIATARAGNVIGGGDWATDRLLPDLARAAQSGKPVLIRNPASTRPWQHVLEPLSGYLVLAQRLAEAPEKFSEAWNFGPDPGGDQPVGRVVEEAKRLFAGRLATREQASDGPHEAGRLMLDSSKARARLQWQPRLGWAEALKLTVEWYEEYFRGTRPMRGVSERQIEAYWAQR